MASLPFVAYALISIGDFAIKLTLLGFSQIIKLLINSPPPITSRQGSQLMSNLDGKIWTARNLQGDNLKVVWPEILTLS